LIILIFLQINRRISVNIEDAFDDINDIQLNSRNDLQFLIEMKKKKICTKKKLKNTFTVEQQTKDWI